MKPRKPPTLESIFPSPAGRAATDEAIDALPVDATMASYIDEWERACADVARSPHIKEKK